MDKVRPSADLSKADATNEKDAALAERPPALNPTGLSSGEVSRRDFFAFAAVLSSLRAGGWFDATPLMPELPSCHVGTSPPKKEWHQLNDLFGMVYLVFLRDWLRNSNLYDTENPPLPSASTPVPAEYVYARTLDGTWNDLNYPTMGSAGRLFGRNVPLTAAFPDQMTLMDPHPRTISTRLMTRSCFKPATTLNVLAAAWIQFQVHDWFSHDPSTKKTHTIEIPHGDPWPHGPITFPQTQCATEGVPCTRPPAFKNMVPHWWDGSQLYGSTKEVNDTIRAFKGGRIKVRESGLLETSNGKEITGFMPNGWIGISLLHGLFALEHNEICRRLAKKHPLWSDDDLYHKARLIVAALLAKIHTLDWTLAALQTTVLKIAMHTNWNGLAGPLQEFSKELQDSELLGGIVGSPTDHHTAPYAMTEEFVAVYRMHPLMPDDFTFYSARDGAQFDAFTLPEVTGTYGRQVLEKYETRLTDILYSLGIANPGAITLKNYPTHLQELKQSDGSYIDLAALEIVRDRERGVPRYNAFRRYLGKRPVKSFEELTTDQLLAKTLKEVYVDVDRIDAMVGMLAETPPKGFAFSDTAFRIFILMASRRLKSDRFYTQPYWCKDTYTNEGLRWIRENTMATVLRRHFPSLGHIGKHGNAFRPWPRIKKS